MDNYEGCSSGQCQKNWYCDRVTKSCETCHSICDPSRNTQELCLRINVCQEHWSQFVRDYAETMTTVSSTEHQQTNQTTEWEHMHTANILGSSFVFCLLFLIILAYIALRFYYNIDIRQYLKDVLHGREKGPIQLSAAAQVNDRLIEIVTEDVQSPFVGPTKTNQ